jgi:hypothetical protein
MIRLVRKRGVILMDDEDLPVRGALQIVDRNYVQIKEYLGMDGTGKRIHLTRYLHRVIMNAAVGAEVDHIDGNPLNNCQSNLRLVSHKENMRNHLGKNRGVWSIRGGKFRASIKVSGRSIHLGCYSSEEEARTAYMAAKKQYHPEIGNRT